MVWFSRTYILVRINQRMTLDVVFVPRVSLLLFQPENILPGDATAVLSGRNEIRRRPPLQLGERCLFNIKKNGLSLAYCLEDRSPICRW